MVKNFVLDVEEKQKKIMVSIHIRELQQPQYDAILNHLYIYLKIKDSSSHQHTLSNKFN